MCVLISSRTPARFDLKALTHIFFTIAATSAISVPCCVHIVKPLISPATPLSSSHTPFRSGCNIFCPTVCIPAGRNGRGSRGCICSPCRGRRRHCPDGHPSGAQGPLILFPPRHL